MKKVTAWDRYCDRAKEWQHNHLEDGHSDLDKPVGDECQTAFWSKAEWQKVHGYLSDNGLWHVLE